MLVRHQWRAAATRRVAAGKLAVHESAAGKLAVRELAITVLIIGVLTVGGCGRPPELLDPPSGTTIAAGATPSTAPTGTPADVPQAPPTTRATPSTTPTTATRPATVAVDCAGQPSADQVVAMLRRTDGLLPAGVRVTVQVAPRCAGSWQYTVVQIPNREPLQVVSEGSPTSFSLVTAGTDVCTIPVRVGAPAGIRALACESVPNLPPTP
ncbi:hypothetical protein O7632_03235 [Solwaraspora sp. WMMD406]|uniref:hypothetical protein n=1 Tax=Solwaraspora sp. WMMD406 TaxID=3016095 RepID=UPI002415AB61|nr:hypothetical protein [Solwaraspora sp. WMMD406]MDG4763129.1 hypothetical protein [Solwaraspora sp. WMMD406]